MRFWLYTEEAFMHDTVEWNFSVILGIGQTY